MKIALATNSAAVIGGIETYISIILPYLVRDGHEILLIVSTKKSSELTNKLELRQVSIDDSGIGKVLEEIRSFRPDLFFDNGIQEAGLVKTLHESIPLYKFSHDYRDSCISGMKQFRRPFRNCKKKFGPRCLLRYFPMGCGGRSPITMIKQFRKTQIHNNNLCNFNKIFVASQWMLEEIKNQGIKENKIIKVGYPSTIRPNPNALKDKQMTGNILFVGRMVPAKGWIDAIKAVEIASKLLKKDMTIHLAGNGPQVDMCRSIARGNSKVICHGSLDSNGIQNLLQNSDALVVPSRWPEPFGLVGLEAMGQGVPVVSYRTGGIDEWLVHGFNGLFADEAFSPKSLGKVLSEIIADPLQWKRYCVNAYSSSLNNSVQNHVARLISEFCSKI
jgi:glycosyltransferase involved in cell wall biosynthesis